MHPLQDDCQKQLSLVMEELELIRTAPLLPLPAAAPSSLIWDIMSASESPAESQFPALHQEGSANAPYIPPGAAAEAASMATMQLNLHAGQKLAEESQTTKRPPSPRQVLKTQPTNTDQLTRELAPEMAGSVSSHAAASKQAAASESPQEQGDLPERSVSQSRDASVLAALYAVEQRVAALHQHVSRVQLEGRSDRQQLTRLARDVQACLEGGAVRAARLPASDLPRLPASNTPTGELSTLDKVASAVRLTSGDLVEAATLNEAHIQAELSQLRRALETVTAVTGMMALGRQEVSSLLAVFIQHVKSLHLLLIGAVICALLTLPVYD